MNLFRVTDTNDTDAFTRHFYCVVDASAYISPVAESDKFVATLEAALGVRIYDLFKSEESLRFNYSTNPAYIVERVI